MHRPFDRRRFRTLLGLILLTLLLVPSVAPSWAAAQVASPEASRLPNIVFVLADDLDAESWKRMPQIQELLVGEGVSFEQFFVADPLCCPSRTSIFRGQYVHNHRVFGNGKPDGGYGKFVAEGLEDSTVATWLQAAGYRTALMGKYLNQYPSEDDPTHVPGGWDEWAVPSSNSGYAQFDYALNENGTLVEYGDAPEDYLTDLMAAKGADFIERSAAEDRPFFLELSVYPPHLPANPAPRHADAFLDARAPRPPSFNEADMSDKPVWLRTKRSLDDDAIAKVDEQYRQRLRSMLAVDDLVGNVVETLEATGELDNTYVLFSSDNGYHLGEHRLPKGKQTAFETDIRVPLVVRGPGVPAGETRDELASNIDLAPTFADWAGATPPRFVDGRSLAPLLGSASPEGWREAVLVERLREADVASDPKGDGAERADRSRRGAAARREEARRGGDEANRMEPRRGRTARDRNGGDPSADEQEGALRYYRVMRTDRYVYVEYVDGAREFYDLIADPYQLENLADDLDPALLDRLATRLSDLSVCAGAGCRAAEDEPVPAWEAASPTAPAATPVP